MIKARNQTYGVEPPGPRSGGAVRFASLKDRRNLAGFVIQSSVSLAQDPRLKPQDSRQLAPLREAPYENPELRLEAVAEFDYGEALRRNCYS